MPSKRDDQKLLKRKDIPIWEKLLIEGQKLIAIQEIDRLLPKIAEAAGDILGADIVVLYEYRTETDDVAFPPIIRGKVLQPDVLSGEGRTRPHRQSTVFKILELSSEKPVYAPNAHDDWERLVGLSPEASQSGRAQDFIHRENIASSAVVCLKVENEKVGVLFINYRKCHLFDSEERKAIELFANQMAIVIQNARHFQRERERASAMDLLQKVTAKMAASLNEDQTLKLIINGAMELLGMDSGVIHLVDDDHQAVIHSYEAPVRFGHAVPRFSEKKGKTWWVVNTGNMVVMPDIQKDKSFNPKMHQMKVRAVLAAPLKVGEKVIGVISLNDSKVHQFSEYDKTLLTMLADHAATAIQTARLFKSERERVRALDLVEQASARIIAASLNEDETLKLLINGAMELLGMDSGVIHLVDDDHQAVIRSYEAPADFGHPVPRFSEKKGKTWWVVNTGNMVVMPDIQKDKSFNPKMHQMKVRAVLAAPLKVGEKVIGVLSLNDSKVHQFTEYEETLLTMLADHAAIAIQNARLFQTGQDRVKALDLVQKASAQIIASLNEDETLKLIINGAMELLGMDSGVIHLVDDDHQAVIHSYEAPVRFGHAVPRFSEKKGKTWWVVNTGNMVVMPDIEQDKSFNPKMYQMNVRAVLAAPLKVGEKVIGVISLNDSKVHQFTEYEKTLLTMLADTAAIAIQKTQQQKKLREAETLASINTFGANFVHKVINILGTLPANFKQVKSALAQGDQVLVSKHMELLEFDVQNVTRIMQAAKDLRRLGYGVSRQPEASREPVDLNGLLQEVVKEAHLQEAICLELHLEEGLPSVLADRITLWNLFGNLVSNAAKAMPQGGTLRLTSRKSDDRKAILVIVTDTGNGIPDAIKHRIFEPFSTTRGDGLGLGLWLARLTMQEMGGHIWFVSEPGKGTEFTVQMPIA